MSAGPIIVIAKEAPKVLENWYKSSDAAHKVIIRHACIGGAIVLIPLPIVGEAACIANQIVMYRALNKLTGVKFSEEVLKNIGKFVLSQVAGALGFSVAILGGVAVVKFVPGLNFLASVVEAPAAGVANYVCGKVYYEMLGGFIRNGGGEGLSNDEIISKMKNEMVSKEKINEMKNEAKKETKGVRYKDFMGEAKKVVG